MVCPVCVSVAVSTQNPFGAGSPARGRPLLYTRAGRAGRGAGARNERPRAVVADRPWYARCAAPPTTGSRGERDECAILESPRRLESGVRGGAGRRRRAPRRRAGGEVVGRHGGAEAQ